jgi:peptide/nickel transport system substrate-binding protein
MKNLCIGGIVLVLCVVGWSTSIVGEQVPAPQGELRIVDKNLSNFGTIVFNVFEHLLELDKDGKLVPHLATSWQWLDERTLEMRLRQGVTFHNGEVFDAEIVKLNVEETTQLRHAFYLGEYLNFKPGLRIELLGPYTLRFVFAEPDGAALARLSYVHIANRQFLREFGWGDKHW